MRLQVSFSRDKILENTTLLIRTLLATRPKGLKGSGSKGYLARLHISSTFGKSVEVDLPHLVSYAIANKVKM